MSLADRVFTIHRPRHRIGLQITNLRAKTHCAAKVRVLGPLLDITDPRTDKRISFVGGIRGTGELQQRVDAGEALIAFSLPAVTTDQLLEVSDAGMTMPPKSTWFEPKLLSGLLTYLI